MTPAHPPSPCAAHRTGTRTRTRAWLGLAALGLLASHAPVRAQKWDEAPAGAGLYAEARAEAWSNGLPVMRLDGDWRDGYRRRSDDQRAYASARAEVGAWLGWPATPAGWGLAEAPPVWRLGAVHRLDATAVTSGDAAEVLRLYQQGQDPAQPALYDARTRLQHWQGRGLALHASSPAWAGVRLHLGWDALNLQRLRTLQTQGTVAYLADGSYAYAGQLHDDDSRYQALFMTGPDAQGQGAALSAGLSWTPTPGQGGIPAWAPERVRLQVDDAWSRLRWQGINGNDALLNSQVQTRDAEGRVSYQAAIQGRYTRRTLVARIPVRTALDLSWSQPTGQWSVQLVERVGLWQRWLSWQGPWEVQPSLGVDPVAHAWRAGLQWRGLSLGYASGMGQGDQRIRMVQLGIQWALWGAQPR